MELMVALAGIALLMADEGEAKGAIELYALASRYPLVANSHWFEDVIGRHIAAVADALPPHTTAAAQERGGGQRADILQAQVPVVGRLDVRAEVAHDVDFAVVVVGAFGVTQPNLTTPPHFTGMRR